MKRDSDPAPLERRQPLCGRGVDIEDQGLILQTRTNLQGTDRGSRPEPGPCAKHFDPGACLIEARRPAAFCRPSAQRKKCLCGALRKPLATPAESRESALSPADL